jgi:hypothetical protein
VCHLTLEGYLTFSSFVSPVPFSKKLTVTEYRPAAVIHNIPLTLAFTGVLHSTLASFVNPQPWKGKAPLPVYEKYEELTRKGFYVYPAKPVAVILERQLAVAGGERLVHLQARFKSMYPWRVLHHYFAPGSEFVTVALIPHGAPIPRVIRIGAKRYGVMRVRCKETYPEGVTEGLTDPVNYKDIVSWGYAPRSVLVLLRHKVPTAGDIVRAELDSVHVLKSIINGRKVEVRVPLPPRVVS